MDVSASLELPPDDEGDPLLQQAILKSSVQVRGTYVSTPDASDASSDESLPEESAAGMDNGNETSDSLHDVSCVGNCGNACIRRVHEHKGQMLKDLLIQLNLLNHEGQDSVLLGLLKSCPIDELSGLRYCLFQVRVCKSAFCKLLKIGNKRLSKLRSVENTGLPPRDFRTQGLSRQNYSTSEQNISIDAFLSGCDHQRQSTWQKRRFCQLWHPMRKNAP